MLIQSWCTCRTCVILEANSFFDNSEHWLEDFELAYTIDKADGADDDEEKMKRRTAMRDDGNEEEEEGVT